MEYFIAINELKVDNGLYKAFRCVVIGLNGF